MLPEFLNAISVFMLAGILTGTGWSYHHHEHLEAVRVTSTWVQRVQTRESDLYLVRANNEVFEVTNSLLHWQWRSADVWALLKPGQCYDFTVHGWRLPMASGYRILEEVRLVPCLPLLPGSPSCPDSTPTR